AFGAPHASVCQAMRVRWHKWWLLAAWVSACGLNPQPDLPSGQSNDGGGNIPGAAGRSTGSGGGGLVISPSTGGSGTSSPGASGGRPDLGSEAGESGLDEGGAGGDSAGGGAGNEAGAAGVNQLAPGPPK